MQKNFNHLMNICGLQENEILSMHLAYSKGFQNNEIATTFEVKETTIKNWLLRGKKKLMNFIEKKTANNKEESEVLFTDFISGEIHPLVFLKEEKVSNKSLTSSIKKYNKFLETERKSILPEECLEKIITTALELTELMNDNVINNPQIFGLGDLNKTIERFLKEIKSGEYNIESLKGHRDEGDICRINAANGCYNLLKKISIRLTAEENPDSNTFLLIVTPKYLQLVNEKLEILKNNMEVIVKISPNIRKNRMSDTELYYR